MSDYRVALNGDILDTVNGKTIIAGSGNQEYLNYLAWVADGNTAEQEGYLFYNYGTSYKKGYSSDAADGEVYFSSSSPTTTELKAAFPTTQGSLPITITTESVSTDTITFGGVTLTAGTDYDVGSSTSDDATNIAAAFNSSTLFSANYTASASGSVITIVENHEGVGADMSDATTSGTIVISNGTATASVWGYVTQYKHAAKLALSDEADALLLTYQKNWLDATATGSTTLATSIESDIADLKTALYDAKIAVNAESV